MFKVLVADSIESQGVDALKAAGLVVDVRAGLDEEPLCEAIADVDAVLVRSRTRVTARALEAARRLRLITRAGIGVDNVDVAAASRRGVIVTNVPDATTTTTAELAIALLCSLARHVPQADRNIRAGKYERNKFLGTEICGKTLGVVGLGRIGRIVADRALGLKMRVIAFDPYLSPDAPPLHGVAIVDFDALLANSDFISIHSPLTDATRNIFNDNGFAKCKRGLRIVNAARGGIINENALAAAVRSGQVAGAALDVTEIEPVPKDSPLRELDGIILTPHLGASTEEAQRRVAIEAAAQIVDFAKTGRARSSVNLSILPDELRDELAPFITLADRLGAFAAAVVAAGEKPSRIKRISLLFHGERFERGGGDRVAAALRAEALAACLRPGLADVTPVSAPYLARERGIEILESREPRDRDYQNRIDLELAADSGATIRVAGTCFGRRPRMVEIDGVSIDANLEGDLLVTRHHDRPGMVGAIGSILGARGVNLDRVDLGSVPNAQIAIGVFGIGGELPDDAVASVRAQDGMVAACRVRLPQLDASIK
ncbi:MAG: phosphoglycerate dehydrogenase [Planctomycetes bacterium]|nr:phosphoglycerate dehydrogenase [Planctomycetota bacterium]